MIIRRFDTSQQCVVMVRKGAMPFVGGNVELPLAKVFQDSSSASENIATLALLVAELAVSNTFLVSWAH